MQQAADAIDRTTAEGRQAEPAPRGVMRVQVEQPAFRVADYVSSGWKTLPAIAGVSVMIFFLTLFLLIADDLFKRKLVKHVGAFARKRVTVQILDEIGQQMERFILVQIFTSVIVAAVTFAALCVAAASSTRPCGAWWRGCSTRSLISVRSSSRSRSRCVGYMQFGEIAPTLSVAARR